MLRIVVLGAAAGGGLPQWNCGCGNCNAARADIGPQGPRSTQTSLAVTSDGVNWFLINASPDLPAQISANRFLHPAAGALRHSPVAGVILTNAEVDAVAGLLSMRESARFEIYASSQVLAALEANPIFNVLNDSLVRRTSVHAERPFRPRQTDGDPAGFSVTPFAVPGKEALYLEGVASAGDHATLGLTLRDDAAGTIAHIVAACAYITDELQARLDGADAIFFDGTLWRDDELLVQGLAGKTGRRMGHVAMDGENGSIARLALAKAKRKVFVHINNSNPVWRHDSVECLAAQRAGWEIGHDGMEIVL